MRSSPCGDDSPMGPASASCGEHDGGGHANSSSAPARNIVPRPPNRTWEECAAYPLAYLDRVADAAPGPARRRGRPLLVVGIGGGVATAGARPGHAMGAHVCVTSRDADKRDRAMELGARRAFDSVDEWPVTADVVVESVGPGHLGPVRAGAGAGRPAGRVRRHLGQSGRAEPAPALLQADRDHRLDDGAPTRSSPRSPPRRRGAAGRGRRDGPLADYPDALADLEHGEHSSARSSSSTDGHDDHLHESAGPRPRVPSTGPADRDAVSLTAGDRLRRRGVLARRSGRPPAVLHEPRRARSSRSSTCPRS